MSDADPRPPAPLDAEGIEAAAEAIYAESHTAGYEQCYPHRTTVAPCLGCFDIARAALLAYEAHRAANLPQDPRLGEIRAREEGATPGPWEFNGGDYEARTQLYATFDSTADEYDADILSAEECAELLISEDNAEFIAHAREDIPYLLSLLANLPSQRDDGEVGRLREALDDLNKLRSNVVATQCATWSNQMYPLVAILERVGYQADADPSPEDRAAHLVAYGGAGGTPNHPTHDLTRGSLYARRLAEQRETASQLIRLRSATAPTSEPPKETA